MIRKHIARGGGVADGPAPQPHKTRALLATKIANLRAARRAGARPEGQNKENVDIARRTEIHQMCNPTPGPDIAAKVRPPRGKVFARRRPRYENTALHIPDAANYYETQTMTAIYDILAVGPGVESVKVGEAVIAGANVAQDVRAYLGPEVFALNAPEYTCDSGTDFPHGTADAWRDEDAYNGPCRCTGMILAVVEA